jgi:hydrogenase expression/formation protein HypC
MQIQELDGVFAVCERRGDVRRVNVALLGDLAVGTHVLVHVDTALRVLEPEEAALVDDALQCLEAVEQGRPIDGFFADLVGREPELPPHLRKQDPT